MRTRHDRRARPLRWRGINDEAPAEGDPYTAYDDFNLPGAYVGLASFQKLPGSRMRPSWQRERPDVAIVGAPFDDGSHRPGARFGPRAIRGALPPWLPTPSSSGSSPRTCSTTWMPATRKRR